MKKTTRKFWIKVHLYLGLLPGIPLLLIGLTGAILAFAPEIRQWDQPQFFDVEPQGELQPIPELVHKIETQYPETNLLHVALYEKADYVWTIYATGPVDGENQFHQMHVNHFTGEIKVDTTSGGWAQWIEGLHRNLTMGTVGRQIVAISSLFLLILCLSGLYLWWPLRSGMWRRLLRNNDALSWHNWTGIIVFPFLILLAFTGITLTWGSVIFPMVYTVTGSPDLPEQPLSTVPADNPEAISMADAVRIIQREQPDKQLIGIGGAGDSTDVFVMHMGYKDDINPGAWEKVYIDQYSGETISTLNTYEHSFGAMYQHTWYSLHLGEFFHTPGRILWAIMSLMLPVLFVTGVIRWMGKNGRMEKLKNSL